MAADYELIEVTLHVKTVVEVKKGTDVEDVMGIAATQANDIVKDSLFSFDKEDVANVERIE